MTDDTPKPEPPYEIGFEIVHPDKTATELEDEWFFKMVDEQVFAHPHGKRPKRPLREQPGGMQKVKQRRAKNKQAAKSRRRNRK